jgi:acetoacetyl-CoA synthetase
VSAETEPIVWLPSERRAHDQLQRFVDELRTPSRPTGVGYDALWRWSVEHPGDFWSAIASEMNLWRTAPTQSLLRAAMPGAVWFPDGALNYVDVALRRRGPEIAIRALDETGAEEQLSWDELTDLVRRSAAGLRRLGVTRGDRVAAYLPNRIETVVAFLATASLGAIWTATSPDFGDQSALDRFRQVEPSVLLVVDGYHYGGRWHDRSGTVAALVAGLPTIRHVVTVAGSAAPGEPLRWDDLIATTDEPLDPEAVPFDHPLWIVYTSGTTGRPKSIVHGHGGIAVEHHKLLRYQLGITADDTFFWFSTTGWVMWNILVGGLIVGAQIVLYDGSPTHPDTEKLWDIAATTGATFLGLSAGFVQASISEQHRPGTSRDLQRVRSVGITGSPLPAAGYRWLEHELDAPFIASISGGTDVATAFVGSTPTLPVHAGRLQRACLGVDAVALGDDGTVVVGTPGELVVRQPTPSMPVGFWSDDAGERYRSAYFDRFPGLWCHGDWIEFGDDGSCVVHGRSDATLNRGGVRMGSSDFYGVLERLPEVDDALVLDTTSIDEPKGRLVLVLAASTGPARDELMASTRDVLRQALSPRHVPDDVLVVDRLPRTLNGKRLEVPVKRLFQGVPADQTVDLSAIDDVDAWDELVGAVDAWRSLHAV